MQNLSFILVYILLCSISGSFITNYEKHFGSKTPYRSVENNNETPIEFEGCQPKKIWYLIRHGARSPTKDVLANLQENLPRITQLILHANDNISAPYLEELKKWKLPFGNDTAVLTEEGRRELFRLALRSQARFSTLFPKIYSKEHYYFKYTDTERTRSSAQNFTFGLFGNDHSKVEFPAPSPDDLILRFHKTCTRWKEEVDKSVYGEATLFRESEIVKRAITAVNDGLNLNGSLTFDDINCMYKGCIHEAASFRHSIWCSLLPFEAIRVYEFLDSLDSYRKNGYLFDVTYKQACPLFKSMIDHFESKEKNPTTTVYFSHDGTLLKLYAHLGLFKDHDGLKHTDFNGSYKWDSSKIGPFATNIAFVLYQCSLKEKVAVLFNERLIKLPNCGSELCDFDDIKLQYNDSINNCAYNQICNITKT